MNNCWFLDKAIQGFQSCKEMLKRAGEKERADAPVGGSPVSMPNGSSSRSPLPRPCPGSHSQILSGPSTSLSQ